MGILSAILTSQLALSAPSTQADLSVNVPKDTIVDTVYIDPVEIPPRRSGIPWNRDRFNPERLIRHATFDSSLTVGYSYTVSFFGGSFGSFAQQSYMAHLAYEFSPDLHLYANMGLWMPLYANFKQGAPIEKEDVRQGRVDVIIPDMTLEYKPTENTSIRLMLINESDALKAYGPLWPYGGYCNPWRYSIFCH